LDRLVRPGAETPRAADPDAICRVIGETTMKQYALQELHPRTVADAHVEGRIHIHELEYPLKLHWLTVDADEVRRDGARVGGHPRLSEPPAGARSLGAHLDARLAVASRQASGGLELTRVNRAYAPFLANDGAVEEAVHLAIQLARISGPPVHVGLELNRGSGDRFALELIRAGGDLAGTFIYHIAPDLFSDEEGVLLLREACRAAVERGRALFVFDRTGGAARRVSRYAVRGPSEAGVEPFALAQAITINLPQAFYRGETGSDFYAELETALDAAARAHLVKRALMKKTGGDAAEYAVGVAGLDEAVRLLSGGDMASDEGALRLGIRILSFLYFRVREEAEKNGLRMALHEVPGSEAAGRFARIDRQMFPRARSLDPAASYTEGVHLRDFGSLSLDAAIASEARFHTLMTQGAARVPSTVRARLAPADLFAAIRRAALETLCAQVSVP
jgi:ribonucleoside-triphosphate reductase